MIKILLKQIKQYKKHTALSILFTALEVIIELSIPLLIATIIDEGILSYNMKNIYIYGAAMVVLAVFSLISGILSGKFAATASSGFSANIKNTMYENIFSGYNPTFYQSSFESHSRTYHVHIHQSSCRRRILCRRSSVRSGFGCYHKKSDASLYGCIQALRSSQQHGTGKYCRYKSGQIFC